MDICLKFFFSVKVQNLHDVGVNSSIPSKQGTEVDWGSCVIKLFLFLASSLHSFTSFLSPKYPEAHEEWVMIILHFLGRQWFCPASSLLASLAPASCCPHPLVLLWRSMKEVFFFSLPPGEEWPSALETLCVGLTVGSLGRSGCFHDDRGHLDQLQGGFTVRQGLTQIQDLGRVKEREVVMCTNTETDC